VIATHCTIAVDSRILMRDSRFDYSVLNMQVPG
jgi:hypothetical protein